MKRPSLAQLPILGCAGFIAFLFLATLWNDAVERDWSKLRLRSAHPLAGVSAPKPAPWTFAAFLSGETQKAVSRNFGRSLPIFSISVRAKNQLLYSLYGVAGSSSVVVGKNAQLYEPFYIDEFCARGETPPDRARIEAWGATVAEIEASLQARDKSFVYLVTPSKAARYPQYLPDDITCPALDHAAFGRNRPNADNVIDSKSLERALREKPVPTFSQRALTRADFDKLAPYRAALDQRRVAYVDGASLMSARTRDFPIDLFSRGGTHWNLLGAALAARETARAFDAFGKGPAIGAFEFSWREAPEAVKTDRDLLDLSNLLWPDAHYPTAIIERRGRTAACPRPPRLTFLGGSFLRELVIDLAQAPCPPEIDYWLYFGTPDGVTQLMRFHNGSGDASVRDEKPATSINELRDSIASADGVLLEENESVISMMKQTTDLREALSPAR